MESRENGKYTYVQFVSSEEKFCEFFCITLTAGGDPESTVLIRLSDYTSFV